MQPDLDVTISTLKGPVTAAWRQEGGRWLCTALEFDIVGVGKSRQAAFAEMQQLLNAYLAHVMQSPGPVEFFHPSDAEEWETVDKEQFRVAVAVAKTASKKPAPSVLPDLTALRRIRNRVRGVDLVPLAV